MSKILLIKAPGFVSFPFPRLGLASMAAALECKGNEVELIDCDAIHYRYLKGKNCSFTSQTRNIDVPINWDYISGQILGKNYDIIGVSCIFSADASNTFVLVDKLKEKYPHSLFIGGGHHLDSEAVSILMYANKFDAIVHGEGEDVLCEIAEKHKQNSQNLSFEGILGLSYFNKNTGDIIKGVARPLKKDIDTRPFPARHKLPLKEYTDYFNETGFSWGIKEKDSPCGILITSRGCPYPCTFCSSTSFWGRRTSLRSADNMLEEIEMLIKQYDIQHFSIVDSTFIVSKERVMEFCRKKIAKGLTFTWLCNGRVDLIDEELVRAMRNAGCTTIGFGVETGSDEIAKSMKKNSSINQVRKAVRIVTDAGILPMCYFMIGYMGETKETLEMTKNFMKELLFEYKAYVDSPFIAIPFPGTEFHTKAKEVGKIRTYDYTKYWLGKRHRSPDKLPFVPDAFTEDEIKQELSAIHEQLIEWRAQLNLDFPTGA